MKKRGRHGAGGSRRIRGEKTPRLRELLGRNAGRIVSSRRHLKSGETLVIAISGDVIYHIGIRMRDASTNLAALSTGIANALGQDRGGSWTVSRGES